jgi:Domain of unknown function (DUF4332)
MSVKAIFAAAFSLLVVTTIAFPTFPPAQALYETLKIPQSTTSIFGISTATILNGITNGFFWVLIGVAVYSLASLASKNDPFKMPVPPHLKTPPPISMPFDHRSNMLPPAITVRKPITLKKPIGEYKIETIEGIGTIRGALLRNMGIRTVDDLLKVGSTKRGRHRIAKEVGVTDKTLLKWIYRADLLRIRGIGRQYSGLLESAGVNTVKDLSMRKPNYLHQTLKTVNRERNLVKAS